MNLIFRSAVIGLLMISPALADDDAAPAPAAVAAPAPAPAPAPEPAAPAMTPEKLSALIAKVATATRARLLADQAAQDAQAAYSEALTLIPKPPAAPAPVEAPKQD